MAQAYEVEPERGGVLDTGVVGEVKKDITDAIYAIVGTGQPFKIPEVDTSPPSRGTPQCPPAGVDPLPEAPPSASGGGVPLAAR